VRFLRARLRARLADLVQHGLFGGVGLDVLSIRTCRYLNWMRLSSSKVVDSEN
jgi:hypothetical protein